MVHPVLDGVIPWVGPKHGPEGASRRVLGEGAARGANGTGRGESRASFAFSQQMAMADESKEKRTSSLVGDATKGARSLAVSNSRRVTFRFVGLLRWCYCRLWSIPF